MGLNEVYGPIYKLNICLSWQEMVEIFSGASRK